MSTSFGGCALRAFQERCAHVRACDPLKQALAINMKRKGRRCAPFVMKRDVNWALTFACLAVCVLLLASAAHSEEHDDGGGEPRHGMAQVDADGASVGRGYSVRWKNLGSSGIPQPTDTAGVGPSPTAPPLGRSGSSTYCVIGAGPGGLQIAYFLHRAGRDVVVLERSMHVASFFADYPRHRKLISINKRFTGRGDAEFNLRHDWHSLISDNETLLFTRYSRDFFPDADEFRNYLDDFATFTGVRSKVRFGWEVASIRRSAAHFVVKATTGDEMECTRVVVATGYATELTPAGVVGLQDLTTSYGNHSLDLFNYENRSVLILGMGNTAFETAAHLSNAASFTHLVSRTGAPRWAWETHYVGDLRAVNDHSVDNYLLKSLDVIGGGFSVEPDAVAFTREPSPLTGRPSVCMSPPDRPHARAALAKGLLSERVEPGHSLSEADQLRSEHGACFDHVIRCLGFQFDLAPLRVGGLNVQMFQEPEGGEADGGDHERSVPAGRRQRRGRSKFPDVTPFYESTSEPGLFFAGAMAHGPDYGHAAGGFIHGLRYTARALWRYLEARFHPSAGKVHQSWPGARAAPTAPAQLAEAILARINVASGPYQMFGQLGDVVVLPRGWIGAHEAPAGAIATYLEDVPLSGAPSLVPIDQPFMTWEFEFMEGFVGHETVINAPIWHNFDPQHAQKSTLLHPIVYIYESGSPVHDGAPRRKRHHLHLLEDLYTDWTDERLYQRPLTQFLRDVSSRRSYKEQVPFRPPSNQE